MMDRMRRGSFVVLDFDDAAGHSTAGVEPPPIIPGTGSTDVIVYKVPKVSRTYLVPAEGDSDSQNVFEIHNGERLDFIVDFEKWFGAIGGNDLIVSSAFAMSCPGIAFVTKTEYAESVRQLIAVSGSTVGPECKVTCTVTTREGRVKKAEFILLTTLDEPGISYFLKEPPEVLDVRFDFADWLDAGDSVPDDPGYSAITVEAVDVDEDPALLSDDARTHPGNNTVKQFVSAGTNGTEYRVTCTLTTTEGRIKVAPITIGVFAL